MSKAVLVDTSFLIILYDDSREEHAVAKKYFKYFLKNNIKMYLSPIVVSEFHQMQSVADILRSGNYLIMPFNVDHGIEAADIAYNLRGFKRPTSNAEFKDDLKLMGQAKKEKMNYIITNDTSTLARYCERLAEAGMFDSKVIPINQPFNESWFTSDGQASLDVDE